MKKLHLFLVATVIYGVLSVSAAENVKNLTSAITHVTVFPTGAQITGVSNITLNPGSNVIAIQGLSPYIEQQSLQVKGKGNFTVLSASLEMNYISELKEKEQIESLRSKIEALNLKIEDEKNQTGILKEEESFLLTNKVIGGKNETINPADFKLLFDFYKTNLSQIRTEIVNRERTIKDLEKELAQLNKQLEDLQSTENLPSGQVIVTLKADANVSGTIELNYFVTGAGWYPSYDIRVNKLDQPVSLTYKANVYQNTGVEWKNVKLTFSNATPNQSGNVPVLYPWFLDFITYNTYGYAASQRKSAAVPAVAMDEVSRESEAMESSIPEFTTSDKTTSIEFNVDVPYTIETGGKSRIIDMMNLELPATFEYQAVPKLDQAAFLVGKITDWQKSDLLDGEANLYFENTFVGKSNLDLRRATDTLNLSLGRDQGIVVKREKRKDFTAEKFIGGNKVVTRSWEITLRNNKKENIKIRLSDQVPLSQNKEITINAEELSGGRLDEANGQVNWDIELPAGQSKSIILTYTVKYPKNKNIILE